MKHFLSVAKNGLALLKEKRCYKFAEGLRFAVSPGHGVLQAPLGFWDPLGLSSDGNLYSFKRRRSVELKHGRICMLVLWPKECVFLVFRHPYVSSEATMGYITPEDGRRGC